LDATGEFGEALKIARDHQLRATRAADAERMFRSASQGGPFAKEAHYNVGILAKLRGDLVAARGAWQAAVAIDAKYNPARAQLLGLELLDRTRASGAVAELERIATDDPFQQDAQNLLTAWKLERAAEMFEGDKKKAAELFEEARRHGRNVLAGDPDNIHAYVNIAITYYRERLFDQAGLVAESALEKHPNAAALSNVLGLVRLSRDNLRAATDAFLAALQADPANQDARLNLAAIELGYGNFDTALQRIDEVLKLRPNDAELLMSRAVALRGLGRYDEAEQGYQASLAARPGNYEAEYNLCILHQQYTQKYPIAKSRCESYLSKIDRSNPKHAEVSKRLKSIEATMRALNKPTPTPTNPQ
jgi:tetratricopeptide (TPR) repeat protein